jgi:hypothetical protein
MVRHLDKQRKCALELCARLPDAPFIEMKKLVASFLSHAHKEIITNRSGGFGLVPKSILIRHPGSLL